MLTAATSGQEPPARPRSLTLLCDAEREREREIYIYTNYRATTFIYTHTNVHSTHTHAHNRLCMLFPDCCSAYRYVYLVPIVTVTEINQTIIPLLLTARILLLK